MLVRGKFRRLTAVTGFPNKIANTFESVKYQAVAMGTMWSISMWNLWAAPAPATQPEWVAPLNPLAGWIAELGDDRFRVREEATRPILGALIDAGMISPRKVPKGWQNLCGVGPRVDRATL